MMENVHDKINDVHGIAKQALVNLDKSERRIRRWTLVTSVAVFITSILLVLLVFTYGSRQLHQIRNQQLVLETQAYNVSQELNILRTATDPNLAIKAHQQTEQLIYCVLNKIDFDTSKVVAPDPSCKEIDAKPTIVPVTPSNNTTH